LEYTDVSHHVQLCTLGELLKLAPQIKDATEAINQVPPLIDALIDLLQTPAGWLLLSALFLWLLINKDFSRLVDLMGRKERQRFEHLDLYVTKPELADEESVKVLRDLRDAHYFKIATGIYAEKNLRSALIKLHDQTSHEVNWALIRRAFPYIQANGQKQVKVRDLTAFEGFGCWYNQLVGYISLLTAAGIFSLFVFSTTKSFASLIWVISGAFAALFFAMFVFAQNWPEQAAKRIQKELAKLQDEKVRSA
jgi:hypothetical protein